MNALEVKVAVLHYLRYKRQFNLVCCEAPCGADRADILAVDKKGFLWEVEIKCSLADLRNDKKKNVHRFAQALRGNGDGDLSISPDKLYWNYPARFYFAVPSTLRNETLAIASSEYPYAGVFSIYDEFRPVHCPRTAEQLHNRVLTEAECWKLVREQSGTLVRAMSKLVKVTNI